MTAAARKTKIPKYMAIAWDFTTVTAAYSSSAVIQAKVSIEQQVKGIVSHLDGAMDILHKQVLNLMLLYLRITTCKLRDVPIITKVLPG